MKLPVFKLEEYLGEREFTTEIMFSGSDMESFSVQELLNLANPESATLWNSLRLHYTEPTGHPLLRRELCKLYGFEDSAKQICTFAGAEEAIFAALQTILNKDDHAIIVTPCYQSLCEIPKSICAISHIEIKFEGDCFPRSCRLDVSEVEKNIRHNTKLLVINFPQNPTGAMISREEQNLLVELARKHNLYIFSDEVYRGLEHDQKDQLPAIASIYEKGCSLGVMSKAYGLAGLRIGWLATRDQKLLCQIEHFKHYLSICNSAPSEILAIVALQNSENIIARNHGILKSNLDLLKTFFKSHAHIFEWFEPKGGCVAFPRLILKQNIFDFAENLRASKGVLLLPGQVFGNERNHFRISYGRFNMPEALKRLQMFLHESGIV